MSSQKVFQEKRAERKKTRPVLLVGLVIAAFTVFGSQPAHAAKNVIIMISDGAGFNTWQATSMYQGKAGKQVFDGKSWIPLAMCTYPLNQATKPTGVGKQDSTLIYNPCSPGRRIRSSRS